jgi:poly [ADP-ribose] polymerase 2/3/4
MFKGIVFCFSGTLSLLRKDYENLVKKNGGAVSASVTGKTTHLVTTSSDYESETAKVSRAKDLDIWIIEEGFIQDSLKKKSLVKEKDYTFGSGGEEDDEEEEEEEEEEEKKVDKKEPVVQKDKEEEEEPAVPERKNTTIIKKRNRKKKEEDETEEEKKEEKTEEPPQKMKKVLVKGKAAVDEDSGYTGK